MRSRYRRIVGLGLSVIDHLYVVEHLRLSEMRLRYSERVVQSGGMTGTALAQAAQLGCRAQLISLHGEDADGRFVRRWLRAAGVDTRRVLRRADARTTVAVVLVERRGGERRFLVPDRRALERRAPRFDLSAIDRALFDEAFAWSRKTVHVNPIAMIDLGHAVTLWQAGYREEAQRLVRDARLAQKNGSPMYDFQLDVLRMWGYGELLG